MWGPGFAECSACLTDEELPDPSWACPAALSAFADLGGSGVDIIETKVPGKRERLPACLSMHVGRYARKPPLYKNMFAAGVEELGHERFRNSMLLPEGERVCGASALTHDRVYRHDWRYSGAGFAFRSFSCRCKHPLGRVTTLMLCKSQTDTPLSTEWSSDMHRHGMARYDMPTMCFFILTGRLLR